MSNPTTCLGPAPQTKLFTSRSTRVPPDRKHILTAAGCTLLLLTACGEGLSERPTCEYTSGNLLSDPEFSTLMQPMNARAWSYSQHAGDKSFEYSASDGILTFERVGGESWGLLAQRVDPGELGGRRVEYSAELKLDLKEPADTHGFGYGGGLSLLAKVYNRVALTSSLDHEPPMGVHDWRPVRVVVDLPVGADYLRVGFLNQAGGKYAVRNPSLRTVTEACEPTVTAE